MTVVETPIHPLVADRRTAEGGVHLVARHYRKGTRLHPHMHREAQLVYAAKGTMQVTTPKGRWLVPPDRAVWVPALLEHAIDVLADRDDVRVSTEAQVAGNVRLRQRQQFGVVGQARMLVEGPASPWIRPCIFSRILPPDARRS